MNELKLPEPDTHCLDDEGGRPIDVWSYSPGLVREILAQQSARHAEELAAYELTVSNLKALRVPDAKSFPAPQAQPEQCWCDEQNLGEPEVSCGDCPTRDYKPERKPMKATDIVALHKSIEPKATAISELMLRTIRAVEAFHGIKETP